MTLTDQMVAYYDSVRPIRDRMTEWEGRRRSAGARVFRGFVNVALVLAAGSVLGLLPYVFVTQTSGPLPSDDFLAFVSRLALPWLFFVALTVPMSWISWRASLRVWPPVPPSTLSPEQLTFIGSSAAAEWMDKYNDSKRREYLRDALLEAAPIFDSKAEPVWRWDDDEFVAKRIVINQSDTGFRVTLSRRQLKSDHDYLRTSWPSMIADLRRLRRIEERTPMMQIDPERSGLIEGLLAVGPKVLDRITRGEDIAGVRDLLGKFRILAYALIVDQWHDVNVESRPDVLAIAREVARLGVQLPWPSETEAPSPERPLVIARQMVGRLLNGIWDLMVVRLVVRGCIAGVLVAIGVVGLRSSVLPRLDDNTAALAILTSAAVIAVGWEQMARRGRDLYSGDARSEK